MIFAQFLGTLVEMVLEGGKPFFVEIPARRAFRKSVCLEILQWDFFEIFILEELTDWMMFIGV